ncbi:protein PBDC1 isoform X2 [Haemorhous mexicanus]|uniref:protein PBDC1 isoform X2 n=1 Tax=Haemorhous mexicanus TaxID=30427 RepID=UPI0028BF1864|nr:protein PBDC1 isoform X2 [Haemorhous mexicanus]
MAAAGLAGLGPGEVAAAAQALALPAESFGNDLISSVEPKFLKLTQLDERIYEQFRGTFQNLRVDVLDPEELKSEAAKEKWRPFCLSFEGLVEDFNFGTLLRLDSRGEYSEENSILATRIQFLAIEIARNREGCNEDVHRRGRGATGERNHGGES